MKALDLKSQTNITLPPLQGMYVCTPSVAYRISPAIWNHIAKNNKNKELTQILLNYVSPNILVLSSVTLGCFVDTGLLRSLDERSPLP